MRNPMLWIIGDKYGSGQDYVLAATYDEAVDVWVNTRHQRDMQNGATDRDGSLIKPPKVPSTVTAVNPDNFYCDYFE